MPERPDEPDYDWLYGTQRKGVGGSRPAGSDDATASQPRPDQGNAPRDPEPTRMLPTVDRSADRRAGTGGPFQTPPAAGARRGPAGSGGGSRGPGRGTAPMASPPSSRRRRPWKKIVAIVVGLWLVFLVAVPLIAWSKIEKVDATPAGDRPSEQPGTTYLLVGSDSRQGLTRKQELGYGVGKAQGRRTDTIMLLHIGKGPNLLMSVPRDSIVPVPGHGTTKVNAAYALGGPDLLVKTLESATGIRIDDYIEIGFAGFVDVVDAVGGIQICPKTAMKDRLANLDIKKGCQDVDGRVALGYARSRHTSGLGDIDRARHQREVVSAVGDKAASPWTVLNPVRYWRLAMAGSDSLAVGEDTGMIATMRFAWAMARVNGKTGLTCGVPIADLAVHWDRTRAKRLFGYIKDDATGDIPKGLCRPSGLAKG